MLVRFPSSFWGLSTPALMSPSIFLAARMEDENVASFFVLGVIYSGLDINFHLVQLQAGDDKTAGSVLFVMPVGRQ
jgi:hypothetical protein